MPAKALLKKPAFIFVGFKSKKDIIFIAQKMGFSCLLIAEKEKEEAKNLFEKIYLSDFWDEKKLKNIFNKIKKNYEIKGIISNYEHYVLPRSFIGKIFKLQVSSLHSAACTRNKALMRESLSSLKENIPYRLVKNLKGASKAFLKFKKNVYLKNIAGVKSKLVFPVSKMTELNKFFPILKKECQNLLQSLDNDFRCLKEKYPDPSKIFLVEKAVQGRQITVASIIGENKIWHAPSVCDIYTAKDIGKNDSFLAFRILPSNLSQENIKKAKKIVTKALKKLDLKFCPAHSELIFTKKENFKIIEIASRIGGYRPKMYLEAYQTDLNEKYLLSLLNKNIKFEKERKNYVSFLEIFAEKTGDFKKISNFKILKNDPHISHLEILAKTGEKVGKAKYNFSPVLRFLIKGKSYEEVYKKSLFYQKKLRVIIAN